MKTQPKRHIFLLTTLTFFLSGCALFGRAEPTPPPTYEGVIVAMGDSLTEGLGVAEREAYPAQLERKLHENGYYYQVINAGVSGETSSGALSRVEWVLTLEPDMIILETGGNDGLRAIDVALTQSNIAELVQTFKDHDSAVVLAGMETVQNLGKNYTAAFQDIYPTVAAEQGVILIPFFLAGVAADPAFNQADGIHPTAEGYTVIVETIYPYVLEAIEKVREK